jgi:hypothetical protein
VTATSTLQDVDGTGWIPVNLSSLGLISSLPIDPTNSTSSNLYYSYIVNSNGSIELTATLESQKKLKDTALVDGGTDPAKYETGETVALWTQASGLVGYWPFDEGSGSTTADLSGNNNSGSFYTGNPTWVNGKIGGAINFNGSSAVKINNVGSFDYSHGITISAWFKPTILALNTNIFASFSLPYLSAHVYPYDFYSINLTGVGQRSVQGLQTLSAGNWYLIVGTYDDSNLDVYLNGLLDNSQSYPGTTIPSTSYLCVGAHVCGSYWTNGILDDIRIYNRALSATEIQNMYNATK